MNGAEETGETYLQFIYTWRITNCRRLARFKVTEALHSNRFVTRINERSIEWSIELYPNGFKAEHRGWMSVFLIPATTAAAPAISGNYTLAILNEDYTAVNVQQSQTTVFKKGKGVGHARYLPFDLAEMHNSGFVHGDDSLLLQYRISLNKNAFKASIELPSTESSPAPGGESRFANIDSPNKGTFDIILTASDWGKFFCHREDIEKISDEMEQRCQTAVRTFEASKSRKTRAPELPVTTASTTALKEVLRFVYTKRLNSVGNLREIMTTAKEWHLAELSERASRLACERLCVDNCVELYLCAVEFESAELKTHALRLILLNMSAATKTDGWQRLVAKTKLIQRIFEKGPLETATLIGVDDLLTTGSGTPPTPQEGDYH